MAAERGAGLSTTEDLVPVEADGAVARPRETASWTKRPVAWLRTRRRDLLWGTFAGFVSLVIAVVALGVPRGALSIPFEYQADPMTALATIKDLHESPWMLRNSHLGVPAVQNNQDFTSGETIQLVVLKAMTAFSASPGLVSNVFFLASFWFVGVAMYAACRALALVPWAAAAAAAPFSLLPFHFYQANHLTYVAYLTVPLIVLLALTIFPRATGETRWFSRLRRPVPTVLACAVIGSWETYFAFFAIVICTVLAVLVGVFGGRLRSLTRGLAISGLLVVVILINNLPLVLYRWAHGVNDAVGQRAFGSADRYGLRISELFLPVDGHRFPPFARLAADSRNLPAYIINALPGERGANLGLLGVIGLLIAIGMCLRFAPLAKSERWNPQSTAARLGLIAIIAIPFAAIGGLSTIIALAGVTEIRTWSRIAPLVGCCALMAGAVVLELAIARAPRALRLSNASHRARGAACVAAIVALGAFAGYDQVSPSFRFDYARVKAAYNSDASFVKTIERTVGPSASIFQLPIVSYPEAPRPGSMFDYDMLRGYLHSATLKWSYGAMRGRPEDWTPTLDGLALDDFLGRIRALGFDGLYVDRFGYGDNGLSMETALSVALGPGKEATSPDGRLLFFDLRSLVTATASFVLVRTQDGFYAAEGGAVPPGPSLEGADPALTWSAAQGSLSMLNESATSARVTLRGEARRLNGQAQLTFTHDTTRTAVAIGEQFTPFAVTLTVQPGVSIVRLQVDVAPQYATGETRPLGFAVRALRATGP